LGFENAAAIFGDETRHLLTLHHKPVRPLHKSHRQQHFSASQTIIIASKKNSLMTSSAIDQYIFFHRLMEIAPNERSGNQIRLKVELSVARMKMSLDRLC